MRQKGAGASSASIPSTHRPGEKPLPHPVTSKRPASPRNRNPDSGRLPLHSARGPVRAGPRRGASPAPALLRPDLLQPRAAASDYLRVWLPSQYGSLCGEHLYHRPISGRGCADGRFLFACLMERGAEVTPAPAKTAHVLVTHTHMPTAQRSAHPAPGPAPLHCSTSLPIHYPCPPDIRPSPQYIPLQARSPQPPSPGPSFTMPASWVGPPPLCPSARLECSRPSSPPWTRWPHLPHLER